MAILLCFSAEASFTAAVLLFVLGYATLSETTRKSQWPLASIPLLFAIQQCSEGILWVTLSTGTNPSPVSEAATWIFLYFAFVNWPLWIPFSLYLVEKQSVRKAVIFLAFLCGISFVAGNLMSSFSDRVAVYIVGRSIQYNVLGPPSYSLFLTLRILYVLAVLVPLFASSLRLVWLFGLLIAATFVLAEYFYHAVFTSVWCFFAAVTSASLFFVLKYNKNTLYKNPSP